LHARFKPFATFSVGRRGYEKETSFKLKEPDISWEQHQWNMAQTFLRPSSRFTSVPLFASFRREFAAGESRSKFLEGLQLRRQARAHVTTGATKTVAKPAIDESIEHLQDFRFELCNKHKEGFGIHNS